VHRSEQDFRFTTRGETLYATCLAGPATAAPSPSGPWPPVATGALRERVIAGLCWRLD